jgi:hypothetical protein
MGLKMTKKKTSKPKVHKPKAVRVVYVERKESNPFGDVGKIVGTGATAIIGISLAGAISKGLDHSL